MPELPRRNGIRQAPKTKAGRPGPFLQSPQLGVASVQLIEPGIAAPDQFGIDITGTAVDAGQGPPITVLALLRYRRDPAETECGQLLLGLTPEILAEFGRIDLIEPDPDGDAIPQHGEGVAIVDADHPAAPERCPQRDRYPGEQAGEPEQGGRDAPPPLRSASKEIGEVPRLAPRGVV